MFMILISILYEYLMSCVKGQLLYGSLKNIKKNIFYNGNDDIGFWIDNNFICVSCGDSKVSIYKMDDLYNIDFSCIIEYDTCVEALSFILCNYLEKIE